MYIAIALANIIIGVLIGISGIAGFLLPMFYTGVYGFMVADSMAMSFAAFFVSGIIGAYAYHKSGDIDMSIALKMGIGSIVGALLGVWCNNMVSVVLAKRALFIMVFLSGLLLFKNRPGESEDEAVSSLMSNSTFLVVAGVIIALISSFTGAGGPVLTVPLLIALGINVRKSVGISLFNSIFIAFPAFLGYSSNATVPNISMLIALCMFSHGIGVMFGAKISTKINHKVLKMFVAVVSVLVSCYMFYNTL
ncbi:sulfite exporter TauE/SafE family protein [Clostridium ganghwense]|uniref:Probable membrane transporter protein n=1 Tax=Clostridium ganghwense TaxID=312089 RepID=A0ABT4CSS2_9CLOT|nr:sulfite exporter TauE/SafE family protein [Clostridium ganghwense]MCY6371473.1 sulfite exporter TauE/SafE family protein [Clostridium ganghwense]